MAYIIISQSLLIAQNKKVVSPEIYDDWKSVSATTISANGNYVSFEIKPQVGDANLIVKEFNGSNEKVFPRGYKAVFPESEDFFVFQVKAEYKKVRDRSQVRS